MIRNYLLNDSSNATQKLGLFRRKFLIREDVFPAQLRQTFDRLEDVIRREGRRSCRIGRGQPTRPLPDGALRIVARSDGTGDPPPENRATAI